MIIGRRQITPVFMTVEEDAAAGPARGESLTLQAYKDIRARIITGTMAPGTSFTENDLSQLLAMSKTPIREALLRLSVEGLIEVIPRRGYVVTMMQLGDINDLIDHRIALEGAAAALAATRADKADLARLQDLADRSSGEFATITGDDMPALATQAHLNNAFHEAVAIATGNIRLHRAVLQTLQDYDRLFVMEWTSEVHYPPHHNDHNTILRHIAARDPVKARRAMEAHIEAARLSLRAAVVKAMA